VHRVVRGAGIIVAAFLALAGLSTWGSGYPSAHNTAFVVWLIALVIYAASDYFARRMTRRQP